MPSGARTVIASPLGASPPVGQVGNLPIRTPVGAEALDETPKDIALARASRCPGLAARADPPGIPGEGVVQHQCVLTRRLRTTSIYSIELLAGQLQQRRGRYD